MRFRHGSHLHRSHVWKEIKGALRVCELPRFFGRPNLAPLWSALYHNLATEFRENRAPLRAARHVRKTGSLIEKLERAELKRRDRKIAFAIFIDSAQLTAQTARNWQSVYTSYTDQEFEAAIERMRKAGAKIPR